MTRNCISWLDSAAASTGLIKFCWQRGTPVAFHNFTFHASLWISVRFLCIARFDSRSFAAKGLFSVFFPFMWLALFSCSVRDLWHKSSTLKIADNFIKHRWPSFSLTQDLLSSTRKALALRFSCKDIIRIAEDAKITASTNVLLIYMSKRRLSHVPLLKRSTPELAHPSRAA